jgi:hypothetical protein
MMTHCPNSVAADGYDGVNTSFIDASGLFQAAGAMDGSGAAFNQMWNVPAYGVSDGTYGPNFQIPQNSPVGAGGPLRGACVPGANLDYPCERQ